MNTTKLPPNNPESRCGYNCDSNSEKTLKFVSLAWCNRDVWSNIYLERKKRGHRFSHSSVIKPFLADLNRHHILNSNNWTDLQGVPEVTPVCFKACYRKQLGCNTPRLFSGAPYTPYSRHTSWHHVSPRHHEGRADAFRLVLIVKSSKLQH